MAGGIFGPIEVVEGVAVGTGVGAGIGDTVIPKLQEFKNSRWQKYPHRPLAPGDAALAAVKGFPTVLALAEEAAKNGLDGDHFGVLVQNARRYPGTSELLELWRRERLTRAEVDLALERAQIPEPYRTAVLDLFTGRLDPAVIATAIQRGIMHDPGFLPVGPPAGVGKVPKFPVSPLNTLDEAKAHGMDFERLFVETAIVGLPASNQQAASAYFRGIIELDDYYRAISEGNTRNEWRDAILEQARAILSPNQYTELQLRGFIDAPERRRLVGKHGMSPADSDRLLDVLGRSIPVHQIRTGLERGGQYPGSYTNVPSPYRQTIQRSNIREEYAELAYANRFTYPSFFAIRGLMQGGVLNADEGYQILLEMGWKPDLARKVADFYASAATGTAAKLGPRVKSAQTSAITEIRSAYLIGQADGTQARDWLGRIGVEADEIDGMIPVWDVMREIPQKGLTAAQIKKAYKSLPDQWPRARALDELQLLGMTADKAASLLDE
jgi:hypothetical protein